MKLFSCVWGQRWSSRKGSRGASKSTNAPALPVPAKTGAAPRAAPGSTLIMPGPSAAAFLPSDAYAASPRPVRARDRVSEWLADVTRSAGRKRARRWPTGSSNGGRDVAAQAAPDGHEAYREADEHPPAAAGPSPQVLPLPVVDPNNELSPAKRASLIQHAVWNFYSRCEVEASSHVGYPAMARLQMDFSPLLPLHHLNINNIGDPFVPSNYHIHSREFEVGVLQFFADLYQLPTEEMWGYVTNGGTEGCLMGLYTGRTNLPGARLFFSKEAHYCIPKAARLLNMDHRAIDTSANGEVDYAQLRGALAENRAEGRPAVLALNIGTTVRGAIDDIDTVVAILRETGYGREDYYYIHADAALFGMMLPFAGEGARGKLTFRKPIDSVSVSGHKFIGVPTPCGVVLCRSSRMGPMRLDVDYIGTVDDTISGSRSGLTSVYMWYVLSMKGVRGYTQDVRRVLSMARQLKILLEDLGVEPVLLNTYSNIVVFKKPEDPALIARWQLSTSGDVAHVVVMPTMELDTLTAFVRDYKACLDASAGSGRNGNGAAHSRPAYEAPAGDVLQSLSSANLQPVSDAMAALDIITGAPPGPAAPPMPPRERARPILPPSPSPQPGPHGFAAPPTSPPPRVPHPPRDIRVEVPQNHFASAPAAEPSLRSSVAGPSSPGWDAAAKGRDGASAWGATPARRPALRREMSGLSGRHPSMLRLVSGSRGSDVAVSLESARTWDPYGNLPAARDAPSSSASQIGQDSLL